MDNDAATGCAVVLGILIALPFFIAAIPILFGSLLGLLFCFVVIPAVAAFIMSFFK